MFLDEARTAAGIGHANVAQVFELGRDDDTYWLAMEYLHGEPLREVIRRAEVQRVRVGAGIAARICADAALGLHAAHELRRKDGSLLGLVHRDVSPHNLFVTYDGHVKVVDFGIAKSADRLAEDTGAGILKGKIAYMSPEQVSRGAVDRRTDVFALGVVLWEMTTGRRLFRSDTDLETLSKLLDCVVPRPSSIVPGYPPELEACVLKALARRLEDRYATAQDFSRALQQYLVRSGSFVGVEEVAELMRALFADRIRTREAHLAWAAELPTPLDVAGPRAAAPHPVTSQAAPPMPIDDDDVPTTVGILAPRPTFEARSTGVDLGATVALPMSFGPTPSPAFGQHVRLAPSPGATVVLAAPPPAVVTPPPAHVAPPRSAPASSARVRAVVIVCLALLAVLGAGALGLLLR
jgi:serine/threonine-protein kinase